jgi:hypothetical protein
MTPPGNAKANFESAIADVKEYLVRKKPVMLAGSHKGYCLTLDAGWLIIEQERYPSKST